MAGRMPGCMTFVTVTPLPRSRVGMILRPVQGNLGHATASFTLDVYGRVTDQMKRDSAERMQKFIKSVSG